MAIVIRMPEVLAGAMEGVIAQWAVSEGHEVNEGDVLAEIETEKATVEYQAEQSGVLARIVVPAGESVEVGTPIAVFSAPGDTDDDIAKALALAGATEEVPPAPAHAAVESVDAEHAGAQSAVLSPAPAAQASPAVVGGRIFASPLVRKLARERAIPLEALSGSGPGGRIVRKDLEAYQPGSSHPSTATTPAPSIAGAAEYVEIKHSSMRKAIARRLTESKSSVPHFYIRQDCMVDRLLQARVELNEALGVKTSVNDWVVKAVAHALVAVPAANVTWTDTAMRQYSRADISVAVATEGGLYTPVIRGVDRLTIVQINAQIREMAEKARSRTITQEEIEGGSFAVTNLGMFGTEEFSAILNPPQSGILAVGAAREMPVAKGGELTLAQVMTVTLSADHRAVDGALAAEWMAAFKKAIENPISLLVR